MTELTALEWLIVSQFDRGIIHFNVEEGSELAAHRTDVSLPRSPLYYNYRLRSPATPPGLLEHSALRAMAKFMCDIVEEKVLSFGGLAPVPDAGVAFAVEMQSELYHRVGNRSVPVLLSDKGTGRLVSGRDLTPRTALLQIDDVASDGQSKKRFILGARDSGYPVGACLVFALRSKKKASRLMHDLGVDLYSVTTAEDTIETRKKSGRISAFQRDEGLRQMELLEAA